MLKKLCISLIFSNLAVRIKATQIIAKHNLYAYFAKNLEACKHFAKDLVNNKGNIPRPGVVLRFSDLEVIALNLTAENMEIDSESYLFALLEDYKNEMPNLISRRQYNDRRKITAELCETIRKRIVERIDGGEDIFIVDSKPVKVCQLSRGKRSRMGMKEPKKFPDFGYCAAQSMHYYGYKHHAVCGVTGVIHSCDLTQASLHELKYLNDVGLDFFQCAIIGDKGYLSAEVQTNLFESAHIELEVPNRLNQKNWKLFYKSYGKIRKRVEADFSQFTDQFNIMRNNAKQHVGFFTRIISKVSVFTVSQYLTQLITDPLAGSSMRSLNSANG